MCGSAAFAVVVRGQEAAPAARVEDRRVISRQPQYYHGWPTLTRRKNGELWVVYSGGREAHVCPFGRVEAMKSRDNGQSWTWPRVLRDSDIDDRDAGILETANGSLLVTSFTSLAFERYLSAAEQRGSDDPQRWPAERLAAWKAARDRLTPEQRQAMLGVWMWRSTDGGMTWSAPYRCLVNSPHGPIQLADGRVLYAGKALWDDPPRVGVCESTDDGRTWKWLAEIPERPGDRSRNYHELHAVETRSGRLVVHIRNHNPQNNLEILQTESSDGGKTWSTPHPIGVWGLPSHLLRLRDGRLLMSYGHRRPPFGNQARISEDEGRTWSAPIVISDDGRGGDLGYPSTVELDDGSLLTVWYELMAQPRGRAVLRQARWRLA
ncbi:MAG: exo-alpha-sialidase [Planctomycetota bacterium]|nr:MAG: exo-alpha-sialidase [Planctomycetota bacterium]